MDDHFIQMMYDNFCYTSGEALNHISETEYIRRRQTIFSTMGGELYPDGDMWCAIVGEMPNDCVVGFGETAEKAMMEWYKNWNNKTL